MKTQEEIQKRLNSLEDSLTRLTDTLGECYDIDESMQIEQEIDFIIGKIETLKWVLS